MDVTEQFLNESENINSDVDMNEQDITKEELSESRWTLAFYDNEDSQLKMKFLNVNFKILKFY